MSWLIQHKESGEFVSKHRRGMKNYRCTKIADADNSLSKNNLNTDYSAIDCYDLAKDLEEENEELRAEINRLNGEAHRMRFSLNKEI